jgi:hypothetical protein
MTDEFEQRLQTDFIFNGCKQDVIDLWLSNRSNWYPTTLIGANISGSGHLCSVTGAYCSGFANLPAFCKPGTMRYVVCTSGESIYVVEACKRDEVPT